MNLVHRLPSSIVPKESNLMNLISQTKSSLEKLWRENTIIEGVNFNRFSLIIL